MTIKKLTIGKETFFAELALSFESWIKGLSGRESMKKGHGLLFCYAGPPQFRVFWMKDMSFPLDVVLLDEDLIVVGILRDLPVPKPSLQPLQHYPSPTPISYALELNKGDAVNIKVGDTLRVLQDVTPKE